MQAISRSQKPPACNPAEPNIQCQEVHGAKAAMLSTGLHLVALATGGIKGLLCYWIHDNSAKLSQ